MISNVFYAKSQKVAHFISLDIPPQRPVCNSTMQQNQTRYFQKVVKTAVVIGF